MFTLEVALLLLVLLGVAYLAHKTRRIHLKLFEAQRLAQERTDNLYAQLEALLALDKDLGLAESLPPTRGWAGSPDFLLHVHRIARRMRPHDVVECSSGTSTIVLARTLQLNGHGHVFSLEHDPNYAAKTRDELQRHGLQAFATVIDAPLREYRIGAATWRWYECSALPKKIDLLVVDGPPMGIQSLARYPAIPMLNDRLTDDASVVLDDAARADERKALDRWKAEFGFVDAEQLAAEKGIAALRRGDRTPAQGAGDSVAR